MNSDAGTHFTLDPLLAADTAFVADWNLCRVLLMDDARFPWLILVPRRSGMAELDDLTEAERMQLMMEMNRAMQLLRTVVPCEKFNVGALGNVVRQLHVHVVARHTGDAAWPGPVWGSGTAQRYEPAARDALAKQLHAAQ